MPSKILKYIGVLAFVLASQINYAQNTIVGKWMLIDDDDTTYMIFDKEGYTTITFKDGFNGKYTTIGGKNFNVDSLSYDLRYSIDTAKKPAHIEISIYLAGTDLLLSFMPGIAQFENEKTLKLNLFEDDTMNPGGKALTAPEINKINAQRPKDFNTDTQILTRVR